MHQQAAQDDREERETEIDEQISDDPVVEEEDETPYDPAIQAPSEAER